MYRGKESAQERERAKEKEKTEVGVEDTEACVCVCTEDSHHQSIRQADRHPHSLSVYVCVRSTLADRQCFHSFSLPSSVHSPVSACAVYLSYPAYLISSAQCDQNCSSGSILSVSPQESFHLDPLNRHILH